jgi:hypothetical protein
VRNPVRTALEEGVDTVAYLDADLEYYPEEMPRLAEPGGKGGLRPGEQVSGRGLRGAGG